MNEFTPLPKHTTAPPEYREKWVETPEDSVFALLWFWRDQPGGGVADWHTDADEAAHALYVLQEHGDPSKEFKLEAF